MRETVREDEEPTTAEAPTVLDQRIADTTPLTLAMRIEACSTGWRCHHPVLTAGAATTVAVRQ
jgi:hypothetical protein